MALSREEIRDIGIATAQHVLEGLGRYTKDYVPPSSIPQGLRDSMIEERTAGDWYRRRANMAKQLGDIDTVAVYEEVIKDEEEHYFKFGNFSRKRAAGNPPNIIFTIYNVRPDLLEGGNFLKLLNEAKAQVGSAPHQNNRIHGQPGESQHDQRSKKYFIPKGFKYRA